MQNENEEYTIDHSKIGRKGYPMHYEAYNAPPPMKKIEKQISDVPITTNTDQNK